MQKILVSRCLLGHRVRYDGGSHGPFDLLERWQAQGRVVALCPEVAGGLPTPRAPAEIPGGRGALVLEGQAPVVTVDGADVTGAFVRGAEQAMALVDRHGIRLAILKARSPSCGNRENYDGSFSGLRVPGNVSVVGFDDIQSAAYSMPALTTVRQPLSEMGKRGAQVLLQRIADREKEFPAEIVMMPELVVRESTGAAPFSPRA